MRRHGISLVCGCLLLLATGCSNSQNNDKIENKNVESKKAVILIYGHPACGKLTIARKLSEKYNLNLMDNHLFNNIIFPYVQLSTKNVIAIDPSINKIREIWMENVAQYSYKDKGFVFTDVLIPSESKQKDVQNLRNFADKMSFQFLAVKLVCDENDIKGRINTPDRRKRFKLTDFNVWKEYVDSTKFLDVEGSVVIKNSNMDNTIKIIEEHLK